MKELLDPKEWLIGHGLTRNPIQWTLYFEHSDSRRRHSRARNLFWSSKTWYSPSRNTRSYPLHKEKTSHWSHWTPKSASPTKWASTAYPSKSSPTLTTILYSSHLFPQSTTDLRSRRNLHRPCSHTRSARKTHRDNPDGPKFSPRY
jgi:hypothetical protein